MSRSSAQRRTGLSDQAYVELVRSLFASSLPSVVMSALFVGVATLAIRVTDDTLLLALAVAGTGCSLLRLAVVFDCRRVGVAAQIHDRASGARAERRFGATYGAFAFVLGLFGARSLILDHVGLDMVVAALLVGYAAGVAAGVSLRPRIGGASILLAIAPSALVGFAGGQLFHVALSIVLTALTVGGLQSMIVRYLGEVDKIELRRAITGLARQDPLTGLPNRLGLAERFDEATDGHDPHCLIAVHCLDLDRFKPVNDRYGHPIGDELLRMVAIRLRNGLREGDVACRIGGDEFVVLQSAMLHGDEAELLARRLVRSLGEPYRIGEHVIEIGVSVGYVVSRCDEPIEALLGAADNALYAIKSLGGGAAAAHSDARVDKATMVA